MFWNKARKLSQTITFRMAVSFAATSACLLLLLSYGLYSLVRVQLTKDDQDVLSDAASLLQITLREQDDRRFLFERQLPQELNAFHYNRYQVRLVSKIHPGRVLFQTVNFPAGLTPRLSRLPVGEEHPVSLSKEQTYLTLQEEGLLGEHNPKPVLIQTVLDVSDRMATLERLKTSLIQFVIVGALLLSGLGILVVKRGLRPLRQFSQRIQGIQMDSLNERIHPRDWPQELGPLSDAFNRLMARLQKDVDQLTRFSGDLAHELRTPITNMRVGTEVLLEKARTVDEYRVVLEDSLIELERLSKVIDRILLLAKVDSPQFALEMAPFAVAPMMLKLFDFYALLAEEKEIRLSLEGDFVLNADRPLVEQAVGNLLSNAIKYTAAHGHVQVRLYQEPGNPTLGSGGGPMGVISIRDDGMGIAPEHLPHLFERFYRVDSSRSQVIAGDGLGLAIVKAIMDVHNGEVTVTSELGVGSEFSLRFGLPEA
jgi:two-component system heavy metal sensor histidine kinase CusS